MTLNDFEISVVIPAWNAGKYIGRTLDGILAQTHPVMEIIVSDDDSKDNTKQIVQGYGGKVRYMWHEHAGCGGSRNFAIRHAKGEWIALHDADDEWFPHKIAEQVRFLNANPGLKWCSCNQQIVYEGEVDEQQLPAGLVERLERLDPLSFFRDVRGLRVCPSSWIFHRSVFDELGLFDESLPLMEDRDMWWRVALHYPQVGYCAKACMQYYRHLPGAMTDFKVRGANRDVEMGILLRHLRASRQLDGEVERDYHDFASRLAFDFIFREAGGQATIKPELVADAMREFTFPARKRLLLAMVKAMPRQLAYRFVDRFRL